MSSLNKVQLIGNVGKDPEVTSFDNGSKVAKFTLATSEKYTDKSGQKQERTDWHNIVAWGPQADLVEKYVTKGRQLYIEGQIRNRSWEQDGVKKFATDINCSTLLFIGNNGGNNVNANASTPSAQSASAPAAKSTSSSSKKAQETSAPVQAPAPIQAMEDSDDDLPF